MIDAAFGLRYFGAIFAIMNPLVVPPLFLALTAGLTPTDPRAKVVPRAWRRIAGFRIGPSVIRMPPRAPCLDCP